MGAIDNSQGFLQVEADVDVAAVLSDNRGEQRGGSPRSELKMRKEEKMPEKWLLETYLPRNSASGALPRAAYSSHRRPQLTPAAALAIAQTDGQTTDHSQRAWALICNGIFVTATVASAINVIAAKLS